ncbi:MAG: hypothetical protein ACT4QB_08195 [Gammaproteobacteria bacterium]
MNRSIAHTNCFAYQLLWRFLLDRLPGALYGADPERARHADEQRMDVLVILHPATLKNGNWIRALGDLVEQLGGLGLVSRRGLLHVIFALSISARAFSPGR